MAKKHSAKRAFISSLLMLSLCFTMFVGTTFAWYTDSVTSSGNKIISGILDVELWKYDAAATEDYDDDHYVNISGDLAPIFQSANLAQNSTDTLWEPGKTQVAYLKIKNVGNLHLKYQVALKVYNISKNLNEVMRYQIVPDANPGSKPVQSWDDSVYPSKTAVAGTQAVSGNVPLAPEAEHCFALVIHMDELAGNEYMNGEVDFDLTVLATQDTVEYDSFSNQYDALAKFAEEYEDASVTLTEDNLNGALYITSETDTRISAAVPSVDENGQADTNALQYKGENDDVFKNFDVATEVQKLVLGVKQTDIEETSVTYDITLKNVTKNNAVIKELSKVVEVTMVVPAGLENVTVRHSGVSMVKASNTTAKADQTYYYDAATGTLYIWTSSFSPFQITWGTRSVFADYLIINPLDGVDILPNEYNFAVTGSDIKDIVDDRFADIEDFNSFIHGAVYSKGTSGREGYEELEGDELLLQNGRQYKAGSETAYMDLEDGKYRYWHGDFVMTFNKDISGFDTDNVENTIILVGEYGDWGWLKIPCPDALEAGKEYRMIHDFMGGAITINFEELCTTVKEFNCGAIYCNSNYDTSDLLTMTIEFRMYPVEDNPSSHNIETDEDYIVVDSFTYTFR